MDEDLRAAVERALPELFDAERVRRGLVDAARGLTERASTAAKLTTSAAQLAGVDAAVAERFQCEILWLADAIKTRVEWATLQVEVASIERAPVQADDLMVTVDVRTRVVRGAEISDILAPEVYAIERIFGEVAEIETKRQEVQRLDEKLRSLRAHRDEDAKAEARLSFPADPNEDDAAKLERAREQSEARMERTERRLGAEARELHGMIMKLTGPTPAHLDNPAGKVIELIAPFVDCLYEERLYRCTIADEAARQRRELEAERRVLQRLHRRKLAAAACGALAAVTALGFLVDRATPPTSLERDRATILSDRWVGPRLTEDEIREIRAAPDPPEQHAALRRALVRIGSGEALAAHVNTLLFTGPPTTPPTVEVIPGGQDEVLVELTDEMVAWLHAKLGSDVEVFLASGHPDDRLAREDRALARFFRLPRDVACDGRIELWPVIRLPAPAPMHIQIDIILLKTKIPPELCR